MFIFVTSTLLKSHRISALTHVVQWQEGYPAWKISASGPNWSKSRKVHQLKQKRSFVCASLCKELHLELQFAVIKLHTTVPIRILTFTK